MFSHKLFRLLYHVSASAKEGHALMQFDLPLYHFVKE